MTESDQGSVQDQAHEAGFDMDEYRRRQRARARVMAILLVAFVLLIFAVTIAKMGLASR